jgi:hypothetical protein
LDTAFDAFDPDVLVAFFQIGGLVEMGLVRELGPAKGYAKAGATGPRADVLEIRTNWQAERETDRDMVCGSEQQMSRSRNAV